MTRVPMDVTIGWGKESLARFMRAVIRFKATVTDSFMLIAPDAARPHDSVFLRVHIPPQFVHAFREHVKPQEMRDPPQVQVGMDPPRYRP